MPSIRTLPAYFIGALCLGAPLPANAEAGDVTPQITDAVTQANVQVLSDAPSIAMGALYQTASQVVYTGTVMDCAPNMIGCGDAGPTSMPTPALFMPNPDSAPTNLVN